MSRWRREAQARECERLATRDELNAGFWDAQAATGESVTTRFGVASPEQARVYAQAAARRARLLRARAAWLRLPWWRRLGGPPLT